MVFNDNKCSIIGGKNGPLIKKKHIIIVYLLHIITGRSNQFQNKIALYAKTNFHFENVSFQTHHQFAVIIPLYLHKMR